MTATGQPAALTLVVDTGAAVPPYEQLRQQVSGLVAGTVARAYRELESTGIVTSGRRSGTRVAPGTAILGDGARQARLMQAASVYAQAAGWLGASDRDAIDALQQALAEVRAARPPAPAH